MVNETKRNEIIYEILKFFKENNKSIHIKLVDGKWLNGIVISLNEDFKDRLVLLEEKYGEMLLFFDRIIDEGITERKVEK